MALPLMLDVSFITLMLFDTIGPDKVPLRVFYENYKKEVPMVNCVMVQSTTEHGFYIHGNIDRMDPTNVYS